MSLYPQASAIAMCRGVLRHLTTISAPLMVCVAGARPLVLPRLYPVHGAASSFLRPTISVQERYSSAPGTSCCNAQSAIVRSVQHRSCECDSSRQRAVGGRLGPHHDPTELSQGRSDYKGQNSFVTPRKRPRASAFLRLSRASRTILCVTQGQPQNHRRYHALHGSKKTNYRPLATS